MPSGGRREPWRLGRIGTAVAPFLSAVIVLVFGAIAYRGVHDAENAARLVSHTHDVIEATDRVSSRTIDAETGERGYIITGDTTYLDPYHRAAEDVAAGIGSLRKLTADNPAQQARVDELDGLARRRFEVLDARIAIRRNSGFDLARIEFVRRGGGKAVMDSARRLIGDMQAGERRLLDARAADQRAYQLGVAWIVIAGAAAAALLAMIISLMLSHSAVNEARLASEARSRAEELDAANSQLQDQAAEMEMLNEELQTTNEQLEDRTIEAEAANRIKADFLANMSHDLRTPLNAIVGYVDLLESGVHGTLQESQLQDLHRIKRSASHLRGLITDVLSFAKVEAGQLHIEAEDVPVERVLAELLPLVHPQVKAKGLEFASKCDDKLIVRADREKVDQILVNLVDNAIKFTASGGRIDVECRADGSWVRAEVRDTGEGIPESQLDAIFTPFVQLDSRGYRTEDHGVGLGLAISRQLARAMHGDLTVTSDLGKGSTFTLRLPRSAD